MTVNVKKTGSFWQKLPKPFFAIAPMANVTDAAFRKIITKYGKPDVMWTEFVSADGLVSSGKKRLLIDLKYSDKERPVVAQLFSGHPEAMKKAAKTIAEMGFDGLDINMGCPDRSVEKQGGGAAMIKDRETAVEVIQAAKEGIKEWRKFKIINYKLKKNRRSKISKDIPISVKTRLGYNSVDWDWIRLLLEQRLPAVTFHLRTRKEMSKVPAHWELMPKIFKMRDDIQVDIPVNERTLIIGNGDIETVEDGAAKCKKYGCDGVMIGRGIFGNPWLFSSISYRTARRGAPSYDGGSKNIETFDTFSSGRERGCKSRPSSQQWERPSRPSQVVQTLTSLQTRRAGQVSTWRISANEDTSSRRGGSDGRSHRDLRLKILLEHAKLFEKTFRGKKHFEVMKKHFKAYVSGWDGAKELRAKLMEAENFKELKEVLAQNQSLW